MSFTAALCEHVAQTPFAQLPSSTVRKAQVFILDSLGVAIAGRRGAFRDELLGCVQGFGVGSDARVWVTGEALPAAHAAMVNAYQIHNQEFDCVHESAVVHPMAVILAALLAHAERDRRVSGQALLLSVVLGVDVAATLGMAARSRLKFFRPAQCGALGATAALMRLRGADAGQIRNALGVCLGQLSGTMQAHLEGVPLLPMQIAFNARNALVSADLAAAGLRGPHDALEGEFGYFKLFESDTELSGLAEAFGRDWRIEQVSHKPYPSGRATHGGIDALQRLNQQHRLDWREIAQVTLFAPPLICQLVDRPVVPHMSANYAKLCFPFVAARCLLSGYVEIDDFAASSLNDRATLQLAERISVVRDQNPDVNALSPQRLVVELRSGARFELAIEHVLGSPKNPLSNSQHLAKFYKNAQAEGIDADSVYAAVDALANAPTCGALLDRMCAKTTR